MSEPREYIRSDLAMNYLFLGLTASVLAAITAASPTASPTTYEDNENVYNFNKVRLRLDPTSYLGLSVLTSILSLYCTTPDEKR